MRRSRSLSLTAHPAHQARLVSQTIEFEYHRPGKPTTVYHERLVLDRPDLKVLMQEHYSGEDVVVADSVVLEHGAPIIWFIMVGAWHDVARFHRADGMFTGWYTNLSKPVEFTGTRWTGSDLFLDLWQPLHGDAEWLDEDEFDAAVTGRTLDRTTAQRALNERRLIDLLLRQGEWPPPAARDLDLAQVRDLLRT